MGAHAVPRPLDLAHPAPLQTAAGARANHVHATARPFRRRATLRTRFRQHLDGHRARLVPTRRRRPLRIDCIAGRRRCCSVGSDANVLVRLAFAHVEALQAQPTENKLHGGILACDCVDVGRTQ